MEEIKRFRNLSEKELLCLDSLTRNNSDVILASAMSEEMHEAMASEILSQNDKDAELFKNALWLFRLGIIDDDLLVVIEKYPTFLKLAQKHKRTIFDEIRIRALEEVLLSNYTSAAEANLVFAATVALAVEESNVELKGFQGFEDSCMTGKIKSMTMIYQPLILAQFQGYLG